MDHASTMAPSLQLHVFATQTTTLVKKNLLLLRRKWISTFIEAYFFPLLIMLLCLNIKNFGRSNQIYGIGESAPVQSLHSSLSRTSKDFVIVTNSSMGSDVARVVKEITEPLADMTNRIVYARDTSEMNSHCVANLRGVSNCYVVLQFDDSPLTAGGLGNWTYTIRTNAFERSWDYDVHSHSNPVDNLWLPLQLAVDNAITNSTDPLNTFGYTSTRQAEFDQSARQFYISQFMNIFLIVVFLNVLPIIYHSVSVITSDRESGLSQLVDAMGGGAAARVTAQVVSLNLVYLPTWIICGMLLWYYVFPESNAAILLFWQVLNGIALTNASILGATFFTSKRVSSVVVAACFFALAAGASTKILKGIGTSGVLGCSLFFPAMNYVFTLCRMARFAYGSSRVDMVVTMSPNQPEDIPETYHVSLYVFFVFLVIQILFYPLLAILAERLLHGISFRRRTLAAPQGSDNAFRAVETSQLRKVYPPSIWRKVFFCAGKSSSVTAVDGLNLVAQRNQILCLLGVNGSGKTTTLDLIGGLQASTAGDVKINAPAAQLGICPQRNVQYSELTVYEHVKFWSEIKGGKEDEEALHNLIKACDLTPKTSSRAGNLSGGQKRKLQLACMFVGGSTVCLMDEVTTGLDPLSRRVIWNIILAERSKRSMLFTTHFLDEGEVLADHIVLLSKGQIKCQGSGAELKNQYGGGYWVHVPRREEPVNIGVPFTAHQDRILYNTSDSASAAELIAKLGAAGETEVDVQGPTIENVFLRLTEDVDETMKKESGATHEASGKSVGTMKSNDPEHLGHQLASGRVTSSFHQILVLMRKRLTVLPRYWIAPLMVLFLPCFLPSQLQVNLKDYRWPVCDTVVYDYDYTNHVALTDYSYFYPSGSASPSALVSTGPFSANDSLVKVVQQGFPVVDSDYSYSSPINMTVYNNVFALEDNFADFHEYVEDYSRSSRFKGGVWFGGDSHPATITFNGQYGTEGALLMTNIWTSARSGVKIGVRTGNIAYVQSQSSGTAAILWVMFAVFIFAVFPAFFALYPAFEKSHKVKALQYANGVRPFPLWMAHLLIDFITVIFISIAITVTVMIQFNKFWFAPELLFPISCLYGLATILISYLMARISRSQLSAFLSTLGVMMFMFVATALAYALPTSFIDVDQLEQATDAISFSLGLVMPTMNLWKAFAVGVNLYKVNCRGNGQVTYPGSIFAYGGPLLLLVIQVISLTLLLVWLESNHSFNTLRVFFKRNTQKSAKEEESLEAKDEISKEAARVAVNEDDLLRISHVTKSFGSNVAVDDVSIGLGKGEILALLGPNGAGKTTIANMIMGELRPDSGHMYLNGIDVHKNTRQAQRSLGVCPQFDALDLMTARQHLEFYARVKGIQDIRTNVELIMDKIGLMPHANKAASKLSGGNKRKLSLAIALIGNPDVLILDEPSSAMDAAAKRVMWQLLAEVAPGRSVLLTTHSMEEADALATRAAIISKRLLAIGTTHDLRQRYSNLYHVALILKSAPVSTPEETHRVEQWAQTNFDDVSFEGDSLGGQIKFTIPNASFSSSSSSSDDGGTVNGGGGVVRKGRTIGRLIKMLEAHKEELALEDYSIGAPTLERVFLSVVKENNIEEEDETKKKRWWRWW